MIAIVGILAAIAIPAYNEYVKRAAESGMAAPAE
jgi:Tfp pilus assembly protein PilE